MNASVPPIPPAVTRVTTIASSAHAVTSSTAAHARAVDPSGVRVEPTLFDDAREHRKGRDAERDAHEERKRMKRHPRWGLRRKERERDPDAEQNGTTMLKWLTAMAVGARWRRWAVSTSSPTLNMKRMTPSWLSSRRMASDDSGNRNE